MNADHDRASGSHAAASGFDVLSDVLRCVRLTGSMLFLVDAHAAMDVVGAEDRGVSPGRAAGLAAPDLVPHRHAGQLLGRAARCAARTLRHGRRAGRAPWRRLLPCRSAGHRSGVRTRGGGGVLPQHGCRRNAIDRQRRRRRGPADAVHLRLPRLRSEALQPGARRVARDDPFARRNPVDRSHASPDRIRAVRVARAIVRWPGRAAAPGRADVRRGRAASPRNDGRQRSPAGWPVCTIRSSRARCRCCTARRRRRWTLEGLAAQAGTSRSVLAERFAQFVGQPPMQYLTQWRMQLATRLLAEPGARKVAAVAEAVGYESEAAFSRAFKKCVGIAPATWRLRHAA